MLVFKKKKLFLGKDKHIFIENCIVHDEIAFIITHSLYSDKKIECLHIIRLRFCLM